MPESSEALDPSYSLTPETIAELKRLLDDYTEKKTLYYNAAATQAPDYEVDLLRFCASRDMLNLSLEKHASALLNGYKEAMLDLRGVARLVGPRKGEHIVDAVSRCCEDQATPGRPPYVIELEAQLFRRHAQLAAVEALAERWANECAGRAPHPREIPLAELRAALSIV